MTNNTINLSRDLAERIEYLMQLCDIDSPCVRELRVALAEPVPPTNALREQVEKAQAEMAEWPKAWRDSEGLEPVLPTGLEPEVVCWRVTEPPLQPEFFTSKPGEWAKDFTITELVDRAHVTRLQAEVERLWAIAEKLSGTLEKVTAIAAENKETAQALQYELTKAQELFKIIDKAGMDAVCVGGGPGVRERVKDFLGGWPMPDDNYELEITFEKDGQS